MDFKEIRKKLKAEKALEEAQVIEAYDTGGVTDTLQNTVNRLVKVIDKSAPSTDMTITFDDGTTDTFKLGK